MGTIQQIYEPRWYKGKNRTSIGDIYYDIYEGNSSLDHQKYPYRAAKHHRSPWVVTCKEWYFRGSYIPLFVNPSDTQWSIPRRGTVQKTAAGAVRNTWLNRYRGTYTDEFTINITFQTGNIMPSNAYFDKDLTTYEGLNAAYEQPQVPPGLMNFYRFLALLDRPKLIGSYENRHIIIMHTRAFPILRLEGFFTEEPITFNESDKDANNMSWTATFQVYRTYPRLSSAWSRTTTSSPLSRMYQAFVRKDASGEAIDRSKLRSLDQTGTLFQEGIDNLAGIPGNTRSPAETATSISTGTAANARQSALKSLQTAAGGSRKPADTLQTKPLSKGFTDLAGL